MADNTQKITPLPVVKNPAAADDSAEGKKTTRGRKGKPPIDWIGIEREYKAGQLSLAEIARQYGCTLPTIYNRKAKYNWGPRPLTNQVRRRVESKLLEKEAKAAGAAQPDTMTDEEIVEVAAERAAMIVELHRKDIEQQRKIAEKLYRELMADESFTVVDKRGEPRKTKLTPKEKSEMFRNLAQAASKYITLERQAWSLDDLKRSEGKVLIELD